MKDHDTCGCLALTNGCDRHQPTGDRLRDRMTGYSKFTEIQMESSIECQSDTFLVLNSRHGLPLGASLFGRAKGSRFQWKNRHWIRGAGASKFAPLFPQGETAWGILQESSLLAVVT